MVSSPPAEAVRLSSCDPGSSSESGSSTLLRDKGKFCESSYLQGVCHKILKPIWSPDKQAKIFPNSVSILARYSNLKGTLLYVFYSTSFWMITIPFCILSHIKNYIFVSFSDQDRLWPSPSVSGSKFQAKQSFFRDSADVKIIFKNFRQD